MVGSYLYSNPRTVSALNLIIIFVFMVGVLTVMVCIGIRSMVVYFIMYRYTVWLCCVFVDTQRTNHSIHFVWMMKQKIIEYSPSHTQAHKLSVIFLFLTAAKSFGWTQLVGRYCCFIYCSPVTFNFYFTLNLKQPSLTFKAR